YELPLVRLLAIACRRAVSWLQSRWGSLSAHSARPRSLLAVGQVVFVIYMLGVLWSSFQFYDIVLRQLAFHSNRIVYDAAEAVAQLTKPDDLIVVAYEEARQPELFYYADRKGWTTDYLQCSLTDVGAKSKLGAQYAVVVLSVLNDKPTDPGGCGRILQTQYATVASGP